MGLQATGSQLTTACGGLLCKPARHTAACIYQPMPVSNPVSCPCSPPACSEYCEEDIAELCKEQREAIAMAEGFGADAQVITCLEVGAGWAAGQLDAEGR